MRPEEIEFKRGVLDWDFKRLFWQTKSWRF